ncbi:MAG: DUF4389 domain-containing protein [Bacteroidales bacterium]|nr:DUF4389 domain-containing protein [Bacteroidales bacterium]
MKLTVKHQETFSRVELILRTLFGWLYIAIPHGFILFFVGLWSSILTFISFWVVLFTARYPQSFFEFQVGFYRWMLRLRARLNNIADGYPAFGIKGTDENTSFDVPYPEKLSRGILILRILFGFFYVIIPHGFILFFRMIATGFVIFIAWWIVLFTGKYPKDMHDFVTGTIRWATRVNIYMGFMTDTYPPFTGKEIE